MFLTRSIRRKLVVGLGLVSAMLAALAVIAISGLWAFRDVVDDLDTALYQTPRRTELIVSISRLFGPLQSSGGVPPGPFAPPTFAEELDRVRAQVFDFRKKLDRLPPSAMTMSRKPVAEPMLADISRRLDRLEAVAETLSGSERNWQTVQQIRNEVDSLLTSAHALPEFQDGMHGTLKRADRVYKSRFWLLCITSSLVAMMFVGMLSCGYRWIFLPIRRLHQGASRVAQGDFDYRVELKTNDEMAELANSFNKMTARFQETKNDLDRQVRERSKQLVRSERLAGVGFLAAGVAHEINNPLAAISWATESLKNRTGKLEDLLSEDDRRVFKRYLQMIEDESNRCQQITHKLLDFSRGQQAVERSRQSLTKIINEVLDLVSHLSKFRDRTIEFESDVPCDIEINGPEIKQVVLNLVANALDSMSPGGTLTIRINRHTDHVSVAFADDGCGMTPDVIDNLFEPFFTTKEVGKGTGLGLSISNRIVNDHGGRIEAESEGPGCGSTFHLLLPKKAVICEAA